MITATTKSDATPFTVNRTTLVDRGYINQALTRAA